MHNFHVFIRCPYPYTFEEMQAIEEAIRQVYGCKPVYFKEWPVQYLSINNITETTAKQIARTLKFAHCQKIISDKKYGRVTGDPRSVEVEIRERFDGRPDWAEQHKALS